jgi:RNA-directed DNA polymerase
MVKSMRSSIASSRSRSSSDRINEERSLQRLREIMGKLKLTVNKEKTRICKVPEGQFDFLGYTFGRIAQGALRMGL